MSEQAEIPAIGNGTAKGRPSVRGSSHPRYNGGFHFTEGRWRISTRDGSSMTYARALMCGHLGRLLEPHEHVHHKNEDPTGDRIQNLELLDIHEHGRLHAPAAQAAKRANWKFEWSYHHAACIECGTTEDPHYATGRCKRCYGRVRMAEWRARQVAA